MRSVENVVLPPFVALEGVASPAAPAAPTVTASEADNDEVAILALTYWPHPPEFPNDKFPAEAFAPAPPPPPPTASTITKLEAETPAGFVHVPLPEKTCMSISLPGVLAAATALAAASDADELADDALADALDALAAAADADDPAEDALDDADAALALMLLSRASGVVALEKPT